MNLPFRDIRITLASHAMHLVYLFCARTFYSSHIKSIKPAHGGPTAFLSLWPASITPRLAYSLTKHMISEWMFSLRYMTRRSLSVLFHLKRSLSVSITVIYAVSKFRWRRLRHWLHKFRRIGLLLAKVVYRAMQT